MKAWSSFLLLTGAILGLIYVSPRLAFNPGEISQGHAKQREDCASCHQPFAGATDEKCQACHKEKEFAGKPKLVFHNRIQPGNCESCHRIHGGAQTRPFEHDLLPKELAQNCVSCHPRPTDKLHVKLSEDCASCHSLAAFKPASFAHKNLAEAVRADCISCHAKPEDKLHAKSGEKCASCHGTQAFKPATFEHDRYFRFDRHHPDRCEDCHMQGDYSTYSCYGCHEHSPGKIRGEHLEEGIYQYEDCAGCHPSGNEHDARKRPSRAGRSLPQGAQPALEPAPLRDRESEWRREREEEDDEEHHDRRRHEEDDD